MRIRKRERRWGQEERRGGARFFEEPASSSTEVTLLWELELVDY